MTAGGIVDTFDTISLPQLSAGLVWNYAQTATAITLSVAYADFNRDGVVDAGDYVIWRKLYNPNVAVTPYSSADSNGDGFVNDLDYDLWRRNMGNNRGGSFGGGESGFGVPEPSSATLILGGMAFIASGRSRRRVSR
jgi:hypothetical protein